jgi:methionyl-tRNA formyltransferase
MGTPEFAVESLRILVENGCEVVAVVTAPDKPIGRGQKYCLSRNWYFLKMQKIPILQAAFKS